MKSIKFLSRFTLICNLCFILFAIFSYLEAGKAPAGAPGTVERIPFFKEIIIILGFPAIIINFIMCFTYFILIILGNKYLIPRWLAFVNISFLFLQVFYFFLYKH